MIRWLAIAAVIAAAVSLGWTAWARPPARHQAEAILILDPPAGTAGGLEMRIRMLPQPVLARDTMLAMIQNERLYEPERKRMPAEDIVDVMRRDISIDVTSPGEVRIRYTNTDAEAAVRGCRDLMNRILEADKRAVRESAEERLRFAERELARSEKEAASASLRAKAYLDLAASKVAEARWAVAAAHSNQLPQFRVKDYPQPPVAWRAD